MHSVDSQVDAGPLTCFHNLVFKLLLHFRYHFLDTGRMDTSVDNQLMESKSGNFPSDRVEGGQKNGFRGVVHHYFNSSCSFQSPDVTSFATDNPSFNLITFDVEYRDSVLNCSL